MAAQPLFERRLPGNRSLSWEDLQTIPDDDYWGIELIEGRLIVSPSPGTRHQSCVGSLFAILKEAAPADLKVLVAPYDYVPRPGFSLQPDLVVARRADLGPQKLESTPLLVVEVLSPSSRLTDRTLKRAIYEREAVPNYWLVEPDEPAVTALGLVSGAYVEVAHVAGAEELELRSPFPVTLVPSELLDE